MIPTFLAAWVPFWPESASSVSPRVDHLFEFLLIVCGTMTILIFSAIVYFGIRYRHGSTIDRSNPTSSNLPLEWGWTIATTIVFLGLFIWGAQIYWDDGRPPAGADPIYVVGKQWMWKIQHPQGQLEINELHIPVGRPVKLVLASEDVIHDFFVPAFRVKQDAVPGMYNTLWFQATRAGTYDFFCAEYCGTNHARMRGKVVALSPQDYETWLAGGESGSMASQGEKLFKHYACDTCHTQGGRGPDLGGIYGRTVELQNGQRVTADDTYIRRSILKPKAQVVMGYAPIMPTFDGKISEADILKIIAYLRSTRATPEMQGIDVQPPEEAPTP